MSLPVSAKPISPRLLTWYDQFGRKNLPWQSPRTAYRVWVSEIMLQQTQVTTVIGYFERFMQRFDSLATLAAAEQDEVMHYWSGLGYYARCRNLHKSAQLLVAQGLTDLPLHRETLEALPGIGRSTAAAIVAQVDNQAEAILDGNVKRVLARHRQIEGWTGSSVVLKQLWAYAEQFTPNERVADYTQAIMDLGATVCKRSKPLCTQCPLENDCLALKNQQVHLLPTPKKSKKLPEKHCRLLFIYNKNNELLLEKRPPSGIWGGLWCAPELPLEADIGEFCEQQLNINIKQQTDLDSFKHSFSHYHLMITPCVVQAEVLLPSKVSEQNNNDWFAKDPTDALGLPAPISAIIRNINEKQLFE